MLYLRYSRQSYTTRWMLPCLGPDMELAQGMEYFTWSTRDASDSCIEKDDEENKCRLLVPTKVVSGIYRAHN